MFYFDIETAGLDPDSSKIITIQYQKLDWRGNPEDDLVILREWEAGEESILRRFLEDTNAGSPNDFDFVPVGYNLKFENMFLNSRLKRYGLPAVDILGRPMLDLHPIGVIMNGCNFRGASLDQMSGKAQGGGQVPAWYEDGDYNQIDMYVTDEAGEFIRLFAWMCRELPPLHQKYMASLKQK